MSGLLDRFIANKRQFWREFLKLYEEMPELWDVRHPDYRNKELRNQSYDILHNKLKVIQPNASKTDVGRRINIFRTNYRREQMRIWRQQDLGLHSELCKPVLWFYDNMSFLLTQESFQRRARKTRCKPGVKGKSMSDFRFDAMMDPLDTGSTITALPKLTNSSDTTAAEFTESLLLSPKIEIFENELDAMDTEGIVPNDAVKADNADTSASEFNEPASSTSTTLTVMKSSGSQQSNVPLSEASETLAKSWAIQYEEMAPTQRILARKAIADILFEGCMGNLRVNRGESRSTVDNYL
ncbi:uncharacterized protein [Drosophila virilis]|uniref:MADF domain-containing protein n=1 Tax=Drosophila virilis TaxID=7244 RepID=B4LGK7_DROVI|nr:uncharacterized protein LOC6624299 [Drosophila virilis]EDW69445.1 uncharacterized protein Dvir_GJ13242 [Drosophila virilis]